MKNLSGLSWFISLSLIILATVFGAAAKTDLTAAFLSPDAARPYFISHQDVSNTPSGENYPLQSAHNTYLPLIVAPNTSTGSLFYISPTGSDSRSGRSPAEAWATFSRAWQGIYPGDTLILLDGVYYQSLNPNKRNGQPGKLITIKAQNDGQAVIDGQFQRIPVMLGDTWTGEPGQNPVGNWFVIEGIVAKNSNNAVWQIVGNNNILKRVSGYNSNVDGNFHVFNYNGHNNLLEDCIAAGSGRKMILVFQGERRNIIRRCFAGWQEWRGTDFCPGHIPWGENIETYNSSHNIIENSIGYGRTPRPAGGINVFAQSGANAIGNRVLGSIAMNVGMNWDGSDIQWPCPYLGSSCTTCWDPGWLGHRSGFGLGVGNGGAITNNLFQDVFSYGNGGLGFAIEIPAASQYQNQLIRATVVNNGIGAGIRAESCDNPNDLRCEKDRSVQLSRVTAFGVFENNQIECTPAQEPHCTGSDFNGQGARIEYRYHSYFDANNNAVTTLTDIPLWPWPMEDRIREEFNTHLSMYHSQTPELINFSVTNTFMPILSAYGAVDNVVVVPHAHPVTLFTNHADSPINETYPVWASSMQVNQTGSFDLLWSDRVTKSNSHKQRISQAR